MSLALIGCANTQSLSQDEEGLSGDESGGLEAPVDSSVESDVDALSDSVNATDDPAASQIAPVNNNREEAPQSDDVTGAVTEDPLLDRAQRTVFEIANNTTRWFDGFFGETALNDADHVSRGRLTTSAYWDERDNFGTRVRFRARYALPAMQEHAQLIVGRGDVDDLIDGTEEPITEGLPDGFDTEQDDDWLFGFGFSGSGSTTRGLSLGVGVRVSTPLEPYIRLTYRWHQMFNDKWLLSLRPRVFWQNQRGTGLTFQTDLSHVFSPEFVIRWANDFSLEDRVEGLGWRSDLLAYQSLSNNRAFSYGIFVLGESDAEVPVQNYGFEIRYRQRMYREWFYVQLSTGYSWPRFLLEEIRESNFGVGLLFEMRFGQW